MTVAKEQLELRQYIEIGLGPERFVVDIQEIREIIKPQEITELFNCRPYVKGVMNLRGKIVPVYSLADKLDIPGAGAETAASRIVVVTYEDESVGIWVDQVSRVTGVREVQHPPGKHGNLQGSYLKGIGRSATGLVGILDLEKVFSGNEP